MNHIEWHVELLLLMLVGCLLLLLLKGSHGVDGLLLLLRGSIETKYIGRVLWGCFFKK